MYVVFKEPETYSHSKGLFLPPIQEQGFIDS